MKIREIISELLNACFGIAAVILTLCCFATSFGLDFRAWTVAAVCAASGLSAWALARFVPRRFGVPCAVTSTAAATALCVYIAFGELAAQLNYAVNGILVIYHRVYAGFPDAVFFAEEPAGNATLLLSVVGFVFSAVSVLTLCRLGLFFPTLALSVVVLVPCFITVDSPPEPLCFVFLVAVLLALFASSFARRRVGRGSGFALAVSFCVIAAASLILTAIFPYENYERYEWQDELLGRAENISGVHTVFGEPVSPLDGLKTAASQSVNLRREGRRVQSHVPVLKALSESDGRLYLRGVSYADYSDSSWSLLSAEQQALFPGEYDFLFTGSANGEPRELSVITERRSELCYTPYFCTALSEDMSPVFDVGVKNEKGIKSYDFKVLNTEEIADAQISGAYIDYVNDNYLSLPEETAAAVREYCLNEGMAAAFDEGGEMSAAETAQEVKQTVASHGHYALECDRLPGDKDFAVWFLTEAESGYCVHYATAATVMLRALGVPARYVTGYCADVSADRWTTMTTDNAHAWAEYFDPERGWCVLDATPGDFTPAQYEPEQPTTAATTATAPSEHAAPPSKTPPQKSDGGSGFPWQLIVPLASVIVLILIIILKVKINGMLRRRSLATGSADDRARSAYRYLLRLHGRLKKPVPQEIEDIATKARFSDKHVTPDELRTIIKCAEEQRRTLYGSASGLKKAYYLIVLGL